MRSRGGRGLGMLLLAGSLTLGALSAPAAPEAVRPRKIKVSQANESMLFLPAYVAAVQGYFQGEGLEVTQVSKGGGRSEIQALIAREVHFAMADGITQLSAMQEGAKVLAVANIGDKLAVNLAIHRAAAEATGITGQTPFAERLKAIKGLTFGATGPGALPWQVAQHIVKRAGYTPQKEVQIIAAGAGPVLLAALEQRKIDVLIETVPVPETAVERGHAIMLFDLAKGEDPEIGEFLLESLLVRPEYAKQEPDTIRRMVRALLKGSRFVAERSPEETTAVLQKSPLARFPRGVLLAAIASLKGAFPPHGRMSQRALDVTQKLMGEAGQLKRPFTLLEIYTPVFLP